MSFRDEYMQRPNTADEFQYRLTRVQSFRDWNRAETCICYWRPAVPIPEAIRTQIKELLRLRNSPLEWEVLKAAKPEFAALAETVLTLERLCSESNQERIFREPRHPQHRWEHF